MDNQEVSKKLIKLRQLHRWTQDELAVKLNISRQAISKWETGNSLPNVDILISLSKLYKISINEIIEPGECNQIDDFEELQTVDSKKLKESLVNIDMKQIVIASIGASPSTVHFIEEVFPEINFAKERENIGRIRIEEVGEAEEEIVRKINHYITQT